jgi:hypothetical protein
MNKLSKTSEQKRAYQKAYRLRNAAWIKAYSQVYMEKYRKNNPDFSKKYCAKWREDKKKQELLGKEAINIIKMIWNSGWNDHESVPAFQTFVAKLLLPSSNSFGPMIRLTNPIEGQFQG